MLNDKCPIFKYFIKMKGYIKTSRIETSLKALSSVTKSIPQASMKTKVPLV